jgi:hypothetical protein
VLAILQVAGARKRGKSGVVFSQPARPSSGRKSPFGVKFPPCTSGVGVLTGISSILIRAHLSAAGIVSNPTSAFIARSALNFDMPAVGNFTPAAPA